MEKNYRKTPKENVSTWCDLDPRKGPRGLVGMGHYLSRLSGI